MAKNASIYVIINDWNYLPPPKNGIIQVVKRQFADTVPADALIADVTREVSAWDDVDIQNKQKIMDWGRYLLTHGELTGCSTITNENDVEATDIVLHKVTAADKEFWASHNGYNYLTDAIKHKLLTKTLFVRLTDAMYNETAVVNFEKGNGYLLFGPTVLYSFLTETEPRFFSADYKLNRTDVNLSFNDLLFAVGRALDFERWVNPIESEQWQKLLKNKADKIIAENETFVKTAEKRKTTLYQLLREKKAKADAKVLAKKETEKKVLK